MVADISEQGNQETARLIEQAGGEAVYQELDVIQQSDNDNIVELAKDRLGGVDVNFLNAGLMPNSPLSALKTGEWHRMVDVNIETELLSTISDQETAEKMPITYDRYGTSPDRTAHVVAFAIDQPEDTTINEFTIGPANQPW